MMERRDPTGPSKPIMYTHFPAQIPIAYTLSFIIFRLHNLAEYYLHRFPRPLDKCVLGPIQGLSIEWLADAVQCLPVRTDRDTLLLAVVYAGRVSVQSADKQVHKWH